jgi:hypothetical protein
MREQEQLLVEAENDFLVTTLSMCLVSLHEKTIKNEPAVKTHVEGATETNSSLRWTAMVAGATAKKKWRAYLNELATTTKTRVGIVMPSKQPGVLSLFKFLRNVWAHNGDKDIRKMLATWPHVHVYMQQVVGVLLAGTFSGQAGAGWETRLQVGDFKSGWECLERIRDVASARASKEWRVNPCRPLNATVPVLDSTVAHDSTKATV